MGKHLIDWEVPIHDRLRTLAHVAILLTVGILALIHLRVVLQPFIVALMVFFLLQPAVLQLEKRGLSPLPSYLLVVSAFALLVAFTGWWLYEDLAKVVDLLPAHLENIQTWMANVEGEKFLGVTISFGGASDSLDGDALRAALLSMFGEVGNFLSEVVKVLIFLIFIILEAESLPKRFAAAYPADFNDRLTDMLADIKKGINRYVVVKTLVSFGTAMVTAIILISAGIPGWFLWSVLTFILNYVPYIGSMIAVFPPITLSILTLDPSFALVVTLLLLANQQVWGSFLEPKMFGSSLDISPVVLLLLTAFWFWLWGIMGMVLAIPMAVITKIILQNIDSTKPIAILLSESPPQECE